MIDVPEVFYQEEIKCNYLVTNKMKKVWAVELDLLNELKRVCEKYGLTYYADSGTLLGAVRHKGFIPWDDDIDIVMKRSDYNKLSQIAQTEFKAPYFFQDANSDGFLRGFARLRNSDTTAVTLRYADRDINQGIFIDIFPLDHVPDNEIQRKIWLKEIELIHRWMNAVFFYSPDKKNVLKRIIVKYGRKICSIAALNKYYESLCSKFNGKNTKSISYVAYSRGKSKHIWERRWFETGTEVPFEFININIPNGFDERLRKEYGDYMVMVKAPTVHGTILFEPDMPYKRFMACNSYEDIKQRLS